MRFPISALALGAAALVAAQAHAADPGGAWKINGDFPGTINYTVVCTLTDSDGVLAGACKDDKGAVSQAVGAAMGDTWEIAADTTYQGMPIHLNYKGVFQADGSLKGTVDAGIAQGTFTAVRP